MLLAVPTFLGALLLFVVEPMVAKWLLPTLGGSPATWSACLVSFQALLLAGYSYAHVAAQRLSARGQMRVHLALASAGVVTVFLSGSASPELGSLPPALGVPWLLARRIGVPYLVLASTAPLLSRWAAVAGAATRLAGAAHARPYSLYAVSNAGALAGLLAYPFVVEPFLDVPAQLSAWSWAFVAFALTLVPASVSAGRAPYERTVEAAVTPRPPIALVRYFSWLVCALVPSALLVAATNHITVDVAATPLVWVVPLALYLVSFIVAFGAWRPSWRVVVLPLFILGALGLGTNAFSQASSSLSRQLGATLLALFSASLLCHGELAADRPPAAEVTGYYLVVALGGVLGGIFVTFVAPLVFADYYELELTAVATFLVLLASSRRSVEVPWPRSHRALVWAGTGLVVPLLVASVLVRQESETRGGHVVERRRSFLGSLRVIDVPGARLLTHGRIQHGMQLTAVTERRTPTMYFGPGTGLERALHPFQGFHADRPRRIGVVGLGVGTIAAYGRTGDTLRFYEIDQNVVDVARRDFTFLADSAAHLDVVLGDGRLSLAREPSEKFDVLVLDAFSSDSVPVHLLTREAFTVYLGRLVADGLLLANVSNRYLSIDRVVCASAHAHGLACVLFETRTDASRHVSHVEWALMARDPSVLAALTSASPASIVPSGRDVLFTDARASVLSVVR